MADGVYGTGVYGTDTYAAEATPPVGAAATAPGQEKTLVVRVQTLSGTWETLGADRARGVWPENDSSTADAWGPSKASFDLRRDPGAIWPDLAAFTPIELEIGGVLVWSGRIAETPTSISNRVINVQCEGWQFHLDDDAYQRAYVHTRLADYKDIRGMPNAILGAAAYNAAGQVTADGAQLFLGWGNGTILAAGAQVGAIVDLGPERSVKRVVLTWESSNNTGLQWYVQGTNTPTSASGYENLGFIALNTGASGASAFTFASAWRYFSVSLYDPAFAGATGGDHWIKFTKIMVFADTAYEAANTSALKAPTIIRDALSRGTMLLSSDLSDIDADGTVTFNFPEFALDGQKTPREVIQAANAVHDYDAKIDERRRPIFRPKPSRPQVEIGEWLGSSLDDASANSGDEIYNRVVVEGTDAGGEKLTIERSASQGAGAVPEPLTSPAPTNPSFATDTTGWTPSAGTAITRDTAVFNSGPASGRWDRGGGTIINGDTLTATFNGAFLAGTTYVLRLWVRANASNIPALYLTLGTDSDKSTLLADVVLASGAFVQLTMPWNPASNITSGVQLTLWQGPGLAPAIFYIDSLELYASKPTLVDRRGFVRTHVLPVKSSLTPALGQQIGDVWLEAHKTTPFKGTVRIEGDRAAREITTGRSVPPEQLLLRTGELLRLADQVDPDTGGQGRDGRIAEVTYTSADDTAIVALDSRRTSHEALLERLAVVVGTG